MLGESLLGAPWAWCGPRQEVSCSKTSPVCKCGGNGGLPRTGGKDMEDSLYKKDYLYKEGSFCKEDSLCKEEDHQ